MHLHTHVNGYCISTVGEYRQTPTDTNFTTIGYDRLYETMVFELDDEGAPVSMSELDMEPYNTLSAAEEGHMKMCRKWARKGKK